MDKLSIMDFLQGQQDCREGVPHEDGKGESYDRGYATEYELEQMRSANDGYFKSVKTVNH